MSRLCPACGAASSAAARFCAGCGARLAASPLAAPPLGGDQAMQGERRQIAFLFADLVGSTALLQRLGPEDLMDLTADYHGRAIETVERFGGRVARFEGDAAVAFFGYPVAQEECAAQAVRAGRAISAVVQRLGERHRLPADVPLAVRVGIETGWVVVSTQPTASGRIEDTFFAGLAPNMAARLQAVAPPHCVVVGPTTHRLAGTAFTWSDLGAHELKGFTAPVQVHMALGEAAAASRLAGRLRRTRTPMINRHDELAALLDAWDEAQTGRIRCVVISGEAGIGKSRLLHAFHDLLGSPIPPVRLSLQCLPTLTNTAMFPHIDLLHRMAGILDTDTPAERLARLRHLLATHDLASDETLKLLADLLSIPTDAIAAPLAPPLAPTLMSGQLRRQRVFAAFMAILKNLSRGAPVVLVYEDIHWLDQTSMELLGQIIAAADARLLVIATARPDRPLPFLGEPSVIVLPLGRLKAEHCRDMVARLTQEARLPASAAERIVARTDGVPLFLEELTQMMVTEALASGTEMTSLPETLIGLLGARLDQLGPARPIAQIGAVMGRQFNIAMIARVLAVPADTLADQLDPLLNSGLLQPGAMVGEMIFKHALVQEAAYASLLPRRRRQLHALIAQLLIDGEAGAGEAEPESVARHLSLAEHHLAAADWWRRAAHQAIGRGAMVEAASHFRSGLDGLAHLPAGEPRTRAETALLAGLGPTIMVMQGPGAAEFGRIQRMAFENMAALPDRPQLGPITYGLALHHWGRAEFREAARFASELQRGGPAHDDDERTMAAHTMSAMVALHRGEPLAARGLLRHAIALYDPVRHAELYPKYMMDFGVFGRFYLALAECIAGDPDRALALADEAHRLATRLGQPHSVGFSMLAHFITHSFRDEPAEARRWAGACEAFSAEQGFPEFVGLARVVLGWAASRDGDLQAGLATLEDGIALWHRTGFENWQTWFGWLRADILVRLARPAAALTVIAEQRRRIAGNGERMFEALLLCAEARAIARSAERGGERAERLFGAATALARAQGAVAWERKCVAGSAASQRWHMCSLS